MICKLQANALISIMLNIQSRNEAIEVYNLVSCTQIGII